MKATRQGYGEAIVQLGSENPNIVVLDADLSKSTNSCNFQKSHKERFFNCGVAEQSMMAIAAGLAASGKICFTGSFAIFATGRAFEMIRNTIAYSSLNVKICPTHAGIMVGPDGASHQSIEDISLMRSLPNMTVLVPADYIEAKKAVIAAAMKDGPVYVRLGRSPLPEIYNEKSQFEIGKSHTLKTGKDISIIAAGEMVSIALKAAKSLAEDGIDAEVINIRSIKPIDRDALIKSAKKTGAVITAECHSVIGGLGSAVCEVLSENYPVPISMVGVRDRFGQSGEPDELMEYYGLTSLDIQQKAKQLIKRK
jgi:transketolase